MRLARSRGTHQRRALIINKGESITFFVSVNPAQTFTIDVYRLGWYGGAGGRLMQHVDALQGTQQETCPTDPTLGTIVCAWNPSFTLHRDCHPQRHCPADG